MYIIYNTSQHGLVSKDMQVSGSGRPSVGQVLDGVPTVPLPNKAVVC